MDPLPEEMDNKHLLGKSSGFTPDFVCRYFEKGKRAKNYVF